MPKKNFTKSFTEKGKRIRLVIYEFILFLIVKQQSTLVSSSMSLKRYLDEKQQRKPKRPEHKRQELSEEIVQYTDLEFAFVMNGKSPF